jgi:hypothetical protein
MKFANLYILIFAWLYLVSHAIAQSTSVGNGSAIAPSAGRLENYGVNSQSPSANQDSFVSRHNRRGNNPGIGSSFLGTTSPTPEGSPATRPVTIPSAPVSAMRFRSPKLESSFSQDSFNPALESFTPALPNLPRGSNALSSPVTGASTFASQFGSPALENVPSFNKQPSLTDKMQFNSFDSFGK